VSRVVIVTTRWGDPNSESGVVLRLLAGALSSRCQVEVVWLRTEPDQAIAHGPIRTISDSVFRVHEVPAGHCEPEHAALLRTALARAGGPRLPAIAGKRLLELGGGKTRSAASHIASLDPESVVLAGPETWWLPATLRSLMPATRIVSVPLLGGDPIVESAELAPLAGELDGVGVLSHREAQGISQQVKAHKASARPKAPEMLELDVALAVNLPSAESLLVGMSHFGSYVVVITSFGQDSVRPGSAPGHDYLRQVLGPIAIAEVAGKRWSISDRTKQREVPVDASRPNLWKLLRHAQVCLDLRPQGIVGRETLESLLLGTPVVVPELTVAAEHAERSNGGLWYGDYRELAQAGAAIVSNPSLRLALSEQGREWARRTHGDHSRFVEQAVRLTLG